MKAVTFLLRGSLVSNHVYFVSDVDVQNDFIIINTQDDLWYVSTSDVVYLVISNDTEEESEKEEQ